MNRRCAPIVLFVYSRLEHTKQTLDALAANELASQSELFIYSDSARDESDAERVKAVRELVHSVSGFRDVTVIERQSNYGLARNIIEGVTEVCEKYGKVIVLEDDIVTSPCFLTFMNRALERYADKSKVWHISGWNYPIDSENIGDVFFWQVMNCWGWATWSDRWKYFQKNPELLIKAWDKKKIKRFNLNGVHNFWGQVVANYEKRINTWAIFWYATIFENDGLCLNSGRSLVYNSGHDGTGVNCGINNIFDAQETILEAGLELTFPENIQENDIAKDRIIKFYRYNYPSLSRRIMTYPIRNVRRWLENRH